MAAWLLVITLSHLLRTSFATTFESNCTLPATAVNILYTGNIRGTFDILWSCISTLLICTWTVQHLTIPRQAPETKTLMDYWRMRASRAWKLLKWFIVTLLIPELLVGKELQDFVMARKSYREMKSLAIEDGVEWGVVQAYYANLGGFVLELLVHAENEENISQTAKGKDLETQQGPPQHTDPMVVARDTFATNLQGWKTYTRIPSVILFGHRERTLSDSTQTRNHQTTDPGIVRLHLNADQVLVLRTHNILPGLPSISSASVADRNKGDLVVKGAALLQVLWLGVQTAIRTSRHLPVSHLEIAALAFSTTASFTYICSLNKPQGISEPTYITLAARVDAALLARIHHTASKFSGYSGMRISSLFLEGPPNVSMLHPIPNDVEYEIFPKIKSCQLPFTYYFIGLEIAGVIFGVIHCLAWNFSFPSPAEKLLWRTSSLLTAAWTPVYAVNFVLCTHFKNRVWGVLQLGQFVEIVILILYVGARCCLLVLAFRCLFFMETGAFVATLDGLIPHIQ